VALFFLLVISKKKFDKKLLACSEALKEALNVNDLKSHPRFPRRNLQMRRQSASLSLPPAS
jgi:hypothetical protein